MRRGAQTPPSIKVFINNLVVSGMKCHSLFFLLVLWDEVSAKVGHDGCSPVFAGYRTDKLRRLFSEDIPSIHSSPNETTLDIAGPITRSRAKQLEKEIHSQVNANLMFNNQFMLNEYMLLSSCSNVLRNDGVYEPAWDEDGFKPLDI